ncbi:hypothetical protein MNB_SV-13-1928 [hydrothermal vent metagenome]|uniref:Uncharacterized protein n=1 Tax=hydrothermal vent metagenome TaxID=652676 RepID=A0A1W1BFU9_9ZZZZ
MKFFIVLILNSLLIYAGSGDAKIDCKSGSGRSTLSFLDQDIQGQFQGGTFTVDNKSIEYLPQYNSQTNKNNPVSWMIVNMKEGVYTLFYQDTKHTLNFYALPDSMKRVKKDLGNEEHYLFSAIVDWRSTDPRNKEQLKKQIWLTCTMEYAI